MTIVTEKTCTKCNKTKSVKSFYFSKTRNSYLSQCIDCRSVYARNLSSEIRTKKNEGQKKRYRENIDAMRKKNREYAKTYLQKNHDKIVERQREWRKNNRDAFLYSQKKYYYNNREERIQTHRNWMIANKGKNREYKANRRAKIKKAGGRFTADEWRDLCNKHNNCCLCCGSKDNLVADHVIPI